MKTLTAFLGALFLAGTLMAQVGGDTANRRRSGPAPVNAVKEMLALSEEQMTNLMEIQKELQEAIQPMVQEGSDLARQLRVAMQSESIDNDEAALSDLRAQIAAKTEEVNAVRKEYLLAARGLLTNQQLDTLSELEDNPAMRDAVRQAIMLNLIEGPENGRGFNRGMDRSDFMGRRGQRGTESRDR